MTTPNHAYTIARLLFGADSDGTTDGLPSDLKRIADHLAALPVADRGAAWSHMTAARPDGDELTRAVMAVDPAADPPEDEDDPGADAAEARPPYRLTRCADIEPREIDWLWPDRVPLGMLTLMAGDPGLGKSMVTIALAAAVSRGAPMPMASALPDGPADVVLLSAEDDPSRTIVPRLRAAGADLSRVHLMESVILGNGAEALPSLRTDIAAIEAAIASLGRCRLVVIDPVSAYLAGTDDHRNAELRGVLSPLKALAERRNVAIPLVTHISKNGGANAKHRVIGSVAYVGACRVGFLFVRDRDDPSGRRVLMLANKCNIGPEPPTLAYRIEHGEDGPVIRWEDEAVPITADEALAAAAADADPAAASEARACDQWLSGTLAAAGGRVLARDIEDAGKDAGFSKDQLKRSKGRIGAVTDRDGFGKGSQCYWRLPHHEPPDPA